jgi:type IV pilus assembly protein PilA
MLKNRKGFTLLELIVVIVVAGLLAAIAIPSFNNVKVEAKKQAGYQEAVAFVKEINALAAFTAADDASSQAAVAIDDAGQGAAYANGVFTATNGVQHNVSFSGDTATVGAIVAGSW